MNFRRPSHATVVAYLALIAALGGSAYAASKVGTDDLRQDAVTGAKVKNGSVGASDLKAITVRKVRTAAQPDGTGEVNARCKDNEKLIGTAGGWSKTVTGSPPIVSSSLVSARRLNVRGASPTLPNNLNAQVICLRK